MAKMKTQRKGPGDPKRLSAYGSYYASGEGKNINAGAEGTVEYGKNSLSGSIDVGRGYKNVNLEYKRNINKNVSVSASYGSGNSYGVNARVNIPIGSKKKKGK